MTTGLIGYISEYALDVINNEPFFHIAVSKLPGKGRIIPIFISQDQSMIAEVTEDVIKAADHAICDGPEYMLPDYGVDREEFTKAIARAALVAQPVEGGK